MLTQTLSSLNSIFAECQEFLVEQAKWNVLLTVHNSTLGAQRLPTVFRHDASVWLFLPAYHVRLSVGGFSWFCVSFVSTS